LRGFNSWNEQLIGEGIKLELKFEVYILL